jgi:alpha-amylase/alpha-mannosidase (GH57 family)
LSRRYLCIHGHFYQPPRENAWLESVEVQDSAYPFHDWNERVTEECYAPNAASRILDGEKRIERIVDNYASISFNFGPTLLAWLVKARPDIHQAIVEADEESRRRFSGHGNALAQAHSHLIMPLANDRDRRTEVMWGIRDFQHRFGRDPEGMWLPETAADVATLEALAEHGIAFTVLAPNQAWRVRPLGGGPWDEVDHQVDPSQPYLCRLPSGREIALFFYDGPISKGVAFEGLLRDGGAFARRLLWGFDEDREGSQLVHIATDGETYGHHHRHGEMALSFALKYLDDEPGVEITNYGLHLERHPPEWEAQIQEGTSWSCAHGVERWRSDCGCHTGGDPGWHQRWRAPLREALDWLRDTLAPRWESAAGELLKDPWGARDDYVAVILDRTREDVDAYFQRHAHRPLEPAHEVRALELLELQRHALYMFTSCGWFFNDISGIETVQVLQYAGRVVQLAEKALGESLEEGFLSRLEAAESNLPDWGNGRQVYQRTVPRARVELPQVAAHYAVSSLFQEHPEDSRIHCYQAISRQRHQSQAGAARLAVGRVEVISRITRESVDQAFAVLHFGDHLIHGGVREFPGDEQLGHIREEITSTFERADFTAVTRLIDGHFPALTYSLSSLFSDERRRILEQVLATTLEHVESQFRQIYEQNAPLMRFLSDIGMPIPRPLKAAARFIVNVDLLRAVADPESRPEEARRITEDAAIWALELDTERLRFVLEREVERVARRLEEEPHDLDRARLLDETVAFARSLPFAVELWETQNVFYRLLHGEYREVRERAEEGGEEAKEWLRVVESLGDRLSVQVP